MVNRAKRPNPVAANLSPQSMKAAIPKLERRIAELKAIDVTTTRERGEPRFDALEQKIDDTLVEIFGDNTIEHQRYQVHGLDTASINMLHATSLSEVIEGYKRGIAQAISKLQTALDLLNEKLCDLGETPDGRAVRAFGDLDIHPEIERAVGKLFRDGHCANAVEDACKVRARLTPVRWPIDRLMAANTAQGDDRLPYRLGAYLGARQIRMAKNQH